MLAPTYSTEEGSSSDVTTLVTTTAAYKQLADLPLHKQLLTTFTNPEIIRWGLFEAQYGPEIAAETDIFAGEYGSKRLEDLKLRVIEHNVLVVTKYYTRITTARLAELLDLTPDQVRAVDSRQSSGNWVEGFVATNNRVPLFNHLWGAASTAALAVWPHLSVLCSSLAAVAVLTPC